MSGPRIVFCSNNHIYDASLYDACPYCSKIGEEQKELVTPAAAEEPYAGGFAGADGSVSKDPFSEDSFAGTDTGFPGETADFFGPESFDEDPFGATVVGTGHSPEPPVSAEMTAEPDSLLSGTDAAEEETGVSLSDGYPHEKTVQSAPESEAADGVADAESSDDEEIREVKIPFFTKDGVPDPRNMDTSIGIPEDMNGFSSGNEMKSAKESEEKISADSVQIIGDDSSGKTIPSKPREEIFTGTDPFDQKEVSQSDSTEEAAGAFGVSDQQFSEEDEWDSFPLKNEGPVRGWFVLQNGVQKDHSVELCKKSMFIYDYDGMFLVFSRQMEDMTLLATIEQYKAISILPAPGVPFEVNGEARRSCGKLGDYMKLLIGSHRMVYVPVDDRLLNGEK